MFSKNVCWRKTNSSTWITYTNAWLQPQVQNAITPFVEKLAPNKCMARNKVRIVFSQLF